MIKLQDNVNYAASLVEINEIRKHSNADRLACVTINFNNVITSIEVKQGDKFIYFPVGAQISNELLSFANLFENSELNQDKTKKNFFAKNCKVRCMSLRGEKSEGFLLSLATFNSFLKSKGITFEVSDQINEPFDHINDIFICKKYIVPTKSTNGPGTSIRKQKKEDIHLIDGQYYLHQSTAHLKVNIDKVTPDSLIVISSKLHGCNFGVANVLKTRKLSFIEKIAKFFGAKVNETEYGFVYSSRNVVKDRMDSQGYYDSNIWFKVAKEIYKNLPKGFSLYGEIVGFTPTGSYIQKGYDYGCNPSELDYYIFRGTYTNCDGEKIELSYEQLIDLSKKVGFKLVPVYYYGQAKNYNTQIAVDENWNKNFLESLMKDFLEKKCGICKNDVPDEGIVLRVITNEWQAFKLKSFLFTKRESDAIDNGEEDLDQTNE